jgi:hypothetical protein
MDEMSPVQALALDASSAHTVSNVRFIAKRSLNIAHGEFRGSKSAAK